MGHPWRAATSWSEVCRRASGRRKYQSLCQVRATMRRVAMAKRVNELRREAWHQGGIPRWMPYGVKTRLATEFQVCYRTVLADLQAIESWPELAPPVQRIRRRERQAMEKRITVRLPAAVFQRLSEAVTAEGTGISDMVRQALQAYLSGPGSVGVVQADAPESARGHKDRASPEDACRAVSGH